MQFWGLFYFTVIDKCDWEGRVGIFLYFVVMQMQTGIEKMLVGMLV